jgi:hypothetical protein
MENTEYKMVYLSNKYLNSNTNKLEDMSIIPYINKESFRKFYNDYIIIRKYKGGWKDKRGRRRHNGTR